MVSMSYLSIMNLKKLPIFIENFRFLGFLNKLSLMGPIVDAFYLGLFCYIRNQSQIPLSLRYLCNRHVLTRHRGLVGIPWKLSFLSELREMFNFFCSICRPGGV